MKLAALAALALASFHLAGCAADTDAGSEVGSEDDLARARVAAGTFRLYEEARHTPSANCDVYTRLDLANDRGGRATLQQELGNTSVCRIAVNPEVREYSLRLTGTSCGSKVYEGSRRVALGPATTGLASIKITDHRTRVCEDIVPGMIVVEETGKPTSYSYDGPLPVAGSFPAGDANSLSGKLFAAMKTHAKSGGSNPGVTYVEAASGSTVTFEREAGLAQCTAAVIARGVQYSCHFRAAAGGFDWTSSSDSVQAELHEALRVATNGGRTAELADRAGNKVRCEGGTLGMAQVMSYRCDVTFAK